MMILPLPFSTSPETMTLTEVLAVFLGMLLFCTILYVIASIIGEEFTLIPLDAPNLVAALSLSLIYVLLGLTGMILCVAAVTTILT